MKSEENLKSEDNAQQQTEEPSGCKKLLQPKFLIPIIIGAVVIIVLIVVLCVVLIGGDDSSSFEYSDFSNVDSRWVEYYKKAEKFLKDFTLEEKMLLTYSTENLLGACVGSIDANKDRGFPGICLQDGPAGVRRSTNTTHWQAAINTASTFNRELIKRVGAAQGKEFKTKGVTIMLSPCMNILRNPLGGRIWEAYGEDPFLAGEVAVEAIKGMQSQGVLACAKHYIGNEIEDPRHNSSTNIPEQALWEIYIEPFYKSVKKGDVASFMESYNAVNDEFMTKNKRLLQEILKDKIGYAGFIMSDWWAINSDSHEHFGNGCDMNMPGGPWWTENMTGVEGSWWYKIPEWIKSGLITEDRLNDAALRIIASMFKVGQITGNKLNDDEIYPNNVHLDKSTITDETKQLNREVGQESIVLLENKGNYLPLKNNKHNTHTYTSITVFGNSAADSPCLGANDCTCIGDNSTYNRGEATRYFAGYVGLGWGSGTTRFEYQVSPLKAITARAKTEFNVDVKSSTGLTGLSGDFNDIKENIPTDSTLCADLNIIFIAANSGEEYIKVEGLLGDRKDLNAWHNGEGLVDGVLALCQDKDYVLVILGPATVNIKSTWKSNTNIKAILFGGMLGAEGGNAITDVLFGDVVPSGHLTFVWAPIGSYPNVTKTASTLGIKFLTIEYNYTEGLFIGQRYVEKNNLPYDYPFGYGLSYTTFSYSGLSCDRVTDGLSVSFNVKNDGQYDGKAVPMVFLKLPLNNYPEKVFKGFDKKLIKAGATEKFEILIDNHDLSYYDVDKGDFAIASGSYTVYVGGDAKTLPLSVTLPIS